jgi:hypothetical protein
VRSHPIDQVRAGAGLMNSYIRQPQGVRGLIAVGDAVMTTNPLGARGVALGMQCAAAAVDIVAELPADAWADALDAWCLENLHCWYAEHLITDAYLHATWASEPIDPEGAVPWPLVAAAVPEHPEWMATFGPFLGMFTTPPAIDPLREQVRGMLRNGWRPSPKPGPTRDDLVRAISSVSV